jgi:hypothetical protein
LIRRCDEQSILRNHTNETLVGRAEEIAGQRREGLWPRKPRTPRKRDHMTCRIDGVQRAVRSERGLDRSRRHGVDATTSQVVGEKLAFRGGNKKEFRFRIQPDHPVDRREFAAQYAFYFCELRKAIELRNAAFRWETDGDPRHAREHLKPANLLWVLWLGWRDGGRLGSTTPKRERAKQKES